MKGKTFCKLQPALALFVFILAGATAFAFGDSYRLDNYGFVVKDMPVNVAQKAVAHALKAVGTELLNPEAHPVVSRWQHAPCYESSDVGANRPSLNAVFQLLQNSLGINIPECKSSSLQAITYYFTDDPSNLAERQTIHSMMDSDASTDQILENFLDGKLGCYSHAWSKASGGLKIKGALVVLNTALLNEQTTLRCLFISTGTALGLAHIPSVPEGVNPLEESASDWQKTVNLNLLSIFALYHLSETTAEGTWTEVEAATNDLISKMHSDPQ